MVMEEDPSQSVTKFDKQERMQAVDSGLIDWSEVLKTAWLQQEMNCVDLRRGLAQRLVQPMRRRMFESPRRE